MDKGLQEMIEYIIKNLLKKNPDMTKEEAREELRNRNAAYIHREEKRQKVQEIAQEEGISLIHCSDVVLSSVSKLDTSDLEYRLLQNNQIVLFCRNH